MKEKKQMIYMDEVAERMNRPISTIWKWARNGTLPVVKVGKFYMIAESDFQNFLEHGTK